MADKKLLNQKTTWLGLIPLAVSFVCTVLTQIGIVPAGVGDLIARLLEIFGIGGIGYGVRSAVGKLTP